MLAYHRLSRNASRLNGIFLQCELSNERRRRVPPCNRSILSMVLSIVLHLNSLSIADRHAGQNVSSLAESLRHLRPKAEEQMKNINGDIDTNGCS